MAKRELSLASLRAAHGIGADAPATTNQPYTNNYYPFWLMQTGQRVVLRFLPDLNEDNPREFMVEKVMHHLTINGQERKIPCLSMYGEDCPICKISQAYYKVKDEINGKKYWKKKQNLAQAIIVEDPLPPNEETGETHQGKVRILTLGYQLLTIIKEGFADPDLPGHPADYTQGCEFVIKKTEQGKFASYTVGTKFTNRERQLTESELAAAEEGMVDLSTLLPKHPGLEKVQAQLDAEMNGEEYLDAQSTSNSSTVRPITKENIGKQTKEVDWEESSTSSSSSSSSDGEDDMLATIRARRKKLAE